MASNLLWSEQTVSSLVDPAYWSACCPNLTCTEPDSAPQLQQQFGANDDISANLELPAAKDLRDQLLHRGYFKLHPQEHAELRVGESGFLQDLVARLADGVEQLMALGHPASAISMFNEAWLLAASIGPLVRHITGNVPLGDWFTFHVLNKENDSNADASRQGSGRLRSGWGPHRDRPGGCDPLDPARAPGFRPDGTPMYATVWIALTDATPENSCLYMLPACDDPGYYKEGDNIDEKVFRDPATWQSITANPVKAGGLLCFSHRTLHWGSKAVRGSPARIAMSFAFADPAFEEPFFDPALYLPLPPVRLRAALQAGQAIMYSNQMPLSKAALALNSRIFNKYSTMFLEKYAQKISSKAQWERFLMKIGAVDNNGERKIDQPKVPALLPQNDVANSEKRAHDVAIADVPSQPGDIVQTPMFDRNSDSSW